MGYKIFPRLVTGGTKIAENSVVVVQHVETTCYGV